MSIIRNAKAQINSFNNDIDVINTKHLHWQESYKALQEEIQNNRDLEKETADINKIMNELRIAVMPRLEVYVQQYARRDEPIWSKKGINHPFQHIKTIIK